MVPVVIEIHPAKMIMTGEGLHKSPIETIAACADLVGFLLSPGPAFFVTIGRFCQFFEQCDLLFVRLKPDQQCAGMQFADGHTAGNPFHRNLRHQGGSVKEA